jgi:hypothetical protein
MINAEKTLVLMQTDNIASQKKVEHWIAGALNKMGVDTYAASNFMTMRAAHDPRAIDDAVTEHGFGRVLRISVLDYGYNRIEREVAETTTDTEVQKSKPRKKEDSTVVRDTKVTERVTTTYSTHVTEQYALSYIIESIDTDKGYPKYEVEITNSLRPGLFGGPNGNPTTIWDNDLSMCNFLLYQLLKDGVVENRGRAITNIEELKDRIRQGIQTQGPDTRTAREKWSGIR